MDFTFYQRSQSILRLINQYFQTMTRAIKKTKQIIWLMIRKRESKRWCAKTEVK